MIRVHLDYETFSATSDLTKEGVYKYAPQARIDLAAWKVGGELYQHDFTMDRNVPSDLHDLMLNPEVVFLAYNAPFEWVMSRQLGYDLPPERFFCVMNLAWQCSFAGTLEMVGAQLGLDPSLMKTPDGKKLVLKFCKLAPKNRVVDVYDRTNCPEEWERYKDYNKQDVVAEAAIFQMLEPYMPPAIERRFWVMDQKINMTGVPVDPILIDRSCHIFREEKKRLKTQLVALTGLSNPNSPLQLKPWLNAHGCDIDNTQKETLQTALTGTLPDDVRTVIEQKLRLGRTSVGKWESFNRAMMDDFRVRGMFQFAGAQRTNRWAGRIVQLHNMIGRTNHPMEEMTSDILFGGHQGLLEKYGQPMDILAESIRGAITAPEGKEIAISDLSSIESRILGWIAGCNRINNVFRDGLDTYMDFAKEIYSIAYDEVDKEQRYFAKPPVLGCGFGLGAVGLKAYADDFGVDMTEEESGKLVNLWREIHPEVPVLWWQLTETIKSILAVEPNTVSVMVARCLIWRDTNFLFIQLPSGRRIHYCQPEMIWCKAPWDDEKEIENISYMGMDQYARKWKRITTHGGKVVENICQAIARDILADQMLKMHDKGVEIILHVHDEVGVLANKQDADRAVSWMEEQMSIAPDWAEGLILGAEGGQVKRYQKI